MKPSFIYYLFICVIGWWGIKALFGGTFYTSHDGYNHVARIAQYVMAIQDGQIVPRWAGTLNEGVGSPLFVFSYPLPYIFGAIIYVFTHSLTYTYLLLTALSFILSGIGMFLFLKTIFSSKSALVGSLFFMFAPYRFLNIYVRGTLSENIALTFIPLICWAITKAHLSKERKWILSGALFFAGLFLSHYLATMLFMPIFVIYAMILWFAKRSKAFVGKIISMILLAMGLSAFSLIPALFERKYLRFSELINFASNHLVTVRQLIRSPWGYGFSFSGINDEMSFQIGLIHLTVIAIFSLFSFIIIAMHRNSFRYDFSYKVAFLSLLGIAIAIVLMTQNIFAVFFWQKIPLVSVFDFPWRMLGITTFLTSILASFLVQRLKITWLGVSICIILLLYANRNHVRVNQYTFYPDEEFFLYRGSATASNEYTPVWRNETSFHSFPTRYTAISSELNIEQLDSKSHLMRLRTEGSVSAMLRLNILYFPGWHMDIDGKELSFQKDYLTQLPDIFDSSFREGGLINFEVPSGVHTVTARFKETPLRFLADGITVITLMFLLYLYFPKKSHKKW